MAQNCWVDCWREEALSLYILGCVLTSSGEEVCSILSVLLKKKITRLDDYDHEFDSRYPVGGIAGRCRLPFCYEDTL